MFPAIDLPEDPEMQENVFSPLILNRAYRTKAWYMYCPICSSTRPDVGGNKRKTERIKRSVGVCKNFSPRTNLSPIW